MTRTILVVDDNEAAARTVARVVSAAGFDPVVLTDSRAFSATFSTTRPDAVILDVMMPDKDGIDVLRELAGLAPATPVLVVTGHGEVWARMARDLGTILGLGRVEMATKPVSRGAITEFLRSAFAEPCTG